MHENSCKHLLDQSIYLSCFVACVKGVKKVPKTQSVICILLNYSTLAPTGLFR